MGDRLHIGCRRRLVMMARRIVVLVGLGLVLVFHFASELTALVTALGFAAAGIAFALQNVIVVFSNVVAFTGSFFKHPPSGPSSVARPPESKSA